MLTIVLLTPERAKLSAFANALLLDPDVAITWADSAEEALAAAREQQPHLVVIDSPDQSLSLVAALLRVNAMVNTAVVSEMEEDAFHEASEGLGVMARLPLRPGPREAAETLAKLRSLLP